MLRLTASQDAAGDGWISLHLHHTHPFIGFHIERLVACGARKRSCTEIAVFGGAGGAAEESGLLVTAGHAFVHGVFGVCLSPSCTPIKPLAASSQSILLTTLSAALPKPARPATSVCLENAVLHAGANSMRIASACASLTLIPGAGPPLANHSGGAWRRTGVALVKTYKTGSSTLGSLLHRYADTRGLDVAVNAKALRHSRALEPRLKPGTMPKPTECLYEFHTFKPCGKMWLDAQAHAANSRLAPKPLQLIIDHSRWQPLEELLRPSAGGSRSRDADALARVPPCSAFLKRMRSAPHAHTLFVGGHASPSADELTRCVKTLAGTSAARRLAAPAAYREAVPNGLLVTLMRWPPSRFTSAVEQFDIPQQTNVPCKRNRRRSGGRCYGQTCERDFKFTWQCMNQTVHRFGMLSTFMRCLMSEPDKPVPTRQAQAKRRIADLDAILAQRGAPPTPEHAKAYRLLRVRLAADAAATGRLGGAPPIGCDITGDGRGRVGRFLPRPIPASFRFVQESIANTLGWPLNPRPRDDDFARMLHQGGSTLSNGGGPLFAKLALEWLAALHTHLDLVLISEHYDESLLLLAHKLGVGQNELLYLSQKRRKQNAAANARQHAPAAQAALSPLSLDNTTHWPAAALLSDPDGAWLWPHELDDALRANWLDSIAYLHFNASLWAQIGTVWQGAAGASRLKDDLKRFRATRQAVKSGCSRCEALGARECLEAARQEPSVPPPHLCWSMRQDTRSWSEHFFRRMALRFDAAAGAARGGSGDDGAGVVTGNVHWWRCGGADSRAISSRCTRLQSGASVSLERCTCAF